MKVRVSLKQARFSLTLRLIRRSYRVISLYLESFQSPGKLSKLQKILLFPYFCSSCCQKQQTKSNRVSLLQPFRDADCFSQVARVIAHLSQALAEYQFTSPHEFTPFFTVNARELNNNVVMKGEKDGEILQNISRNSRDSRLLSLRTKKYRWQIHDNEGTVYRRALSEATDGSIGYQESITGTCKRR